MLRHTTDDEQVHWIIGNTDDSNAYWSASETAQDNSILGKGQITNGNCIGNFVQCVKINFQFMDSAYFQKISFGIAEPVASDMFLSSYGRGNLINYRHSGTSCPTQRLTGQEYRPNGTFHTQGTTCHNLLAIYIS